MPSYSFKYGIEQFVGELVTLLQGGFNDCVAQYETWAEAKGLQAITMPVIPNDGYYTFTWVDAILNRPYAILIRLNGDPVTKGDSGFSSATYPLDVGVILSNTQNDKLATEKLIRFTEALKTFLEKNWVQNSIAIRTKIETSQPYDFRLSIDSDDTNKISGVRLLVTIAG